MRRSFCRRKAVITDSRAKSGQLWQNVWPVQPWEAQADDPSGCCRMACPGSVSGSCPNANEPGSSAMLPVHDRRDMTGPFLPGGLKSDCPRLPHLPQFCLPGQHLDGRLADCPLHVGREFHHPAALGNIDRWSSLPCSGHDSIHCLRSDQWSMLESK
jgi:hypothetical protein